MLLLVFAAQRVHQAEIAPGARIGPQREDVSQRVLGGGQRRARIAGLRLRAHDVDVAEQIPGFGVPRIARHGRLRQLDGVRDVGAGGALLHVVLSGEGVERSFGRVGIGVVGIGGERAIAGGRGGLEIGARHLPAVDAELQRHRPFAAQRDIIGGIAAPRSMARS